MASVLAIGDLHFKSDNEIQTNAFETAIIDYIGSGFSADAVVVLGDTLHRHDKIDLNPLRRATKFLARLRRAIGDCPLWILIGNHDLPNNAVFLTDEHAFNSLKLWKNTVVADVPTVVEAAGAKFLLVPYVAPGRFGEAVSHLFPGGLASLAEAKLSCVFAHQEFKGAKLGPTVSVNGDAYPKSGAPICVSGHIHEYDKSMSNVLYVGTPFDHSWSSPQESAGAYAPAVLKFDHGALVGVKRLFEVSAAVPRNLVVTYGSLSELENASSAGIIDGFYSALAINKLKVKVKCTGRDDAHAISKGTSCIKKLRETGITVVPEFARSSVDVVSERLAVEIVSRARLAMPFAERIRNDEKYKLLSREAICLLDEIVNAK